MTTALRRVVAGAGLAALSFFAYVTAIPLAFKMLYFALLLISVCWIWTRLGARGLSVERDSIAGAYQVGEAFSEMVKVENRSIVGLPWIEVIDGAGLPGYSAGRAISLGARRMRRWRADGRFESRGHYRMGPLTVVTGDPFGLFERRRVFAPATTVTVYPRLVDIHQLLAGSSHTSGEAIALGRYMDAPPDALGIREFDPMDGFNRIHWPSTARLGRPMSRSFEKYEGADTLIILDLEAGIHAGRGMQSTLEYAASLAASVAMAVLGQGQSAGLVCNDARRTSISSSRGTQQLLRILEFLAIAEADGHTNLDGILKSMAGRRERQSLVVVTPRAEGAWVDRVAALSSRGAQRGVVFHLEAETFGGRLGRKRTRAYRRGTEQLTWWSFSAGDELFSTSAAVERTAPLPFEVRVA